MRVAAYPRVSTDEQVDKGNSIAEQKERLAAYCTAMGWEPPTYFIDDGYSAKDLKRPGITAMLDAVKKGDFDIVLTTKLDRLCRNLLDLLQTVKLLGEHNCNFVSSSEGFDTSTSVGRMTLQLLGTFAEFERERIRERVMDNMTSLAKNTDKALTMPCYGYDVIDGKYVINQEEKKNVLYMFDLAELGHGHRMIAKLLNERGAVTKKGMPWDQVNVKRLIKTETLAGIRVYNKRTQRHGKTVMRDKEEWVIKDENHPAIIPIDRFNRIQEIMASRSLAHKHADNETYLLTGLVKCKHCGRGMKGSTSRNKRQNNEYTYYRYICSSYVLGYGCKHHAVHRDDLEQAIIEEVRQVASKSTKNLRVKVASISIADEIDHVRSMLAKSDRKLQKQLEAYENDLISADDLKRARQRVDAERLELQTRLKKLEERTGNPATLKINANKLLEQITGFDRIKAKHAMRQLIDQIELEDGQNVGITWKV